MKVFVLVGVDKTCAVVTSLKSEGINNFATEARSLAGLKVIYEGKSLNNRKYYTRNNFFSRALTEIVCVLFFDIVPLLRNTLGPPVHKLADAL